MSEKWGHPVKKIPKKKFCPLRGHSTMEERREASCDDECALYSEVGKCCVFVTYTRLLETIWNELRFKAPQK